jgi:3-methyladenine DNA glycosylase AlkD
MTEHTTDLLQLRRALEAKADPVYREGSLGVASTKLETLGVRTPDLRRTAKKWVRNNQDSDTATVEQIAVSLWSARSRDERLLGLEILRWFPGAVERLPESLLFEWSGEIDSWPVCDLLGTAIVGRWILAGPPERKQFLYRLVQEDGVWRPRLAIVSTVPIIRSGEVPVDYSLSLLDRVLGRQEPLIVKAVSWSLRDMAKRDRRRAQRYLRDRDDLLPALVRREVGNVLRTGRKSGRA